jgi:hypothetical protein
MCVCERKRGVWVALVAGFRIPVSFTILFVCFSWCAVHTLFIIKSLEFKSLYNQSRYSVVAAFLTVLRYKAMLTH